MQYDEATIFHHANPADFKYKAKIYYVYYKTNGVNFLGIYQLRIL